MALVDDDSPYGEALSNNIRTFNRHRVRIVFSQSVGPYGRYGYLVALARALKADCFVYTGSRNPNTVDIFKAFARALPAARLYGSDGQVTASFYDPAEQGLPADVADRVQIMVPPRNAARYNVFARGFARRYGHRPDPSAVYAYEAMRLALAAIGRSNGHRDDIVRRLMDTAADDLSMLGGYSIRPRTGDTDLALYGVSRISDGRLTAPRHAPRLLADISAPA